MTRRPTLFPLAAATLWATALAAAPPPPPALAYSFADLADYAAAAPVVAVVTVTGASRLKPAEAPGIAAGQARFYVEAAVAALLHAPGELPGTVSLLADLPLGPANRPPQLKGARMILFAWPVPGRPGTLRLPGPAAFTAWTPGTEARLRALLAALAAPDRPPQVTGVANAFHVAGTLPGEGETQIFLLTATGKPISLSVLRRPGEAPRWAVALGEIVDEAALPPPRDTLLWYRLACGLPPTLPDAALADLPPADADSARADYRVVLDRLGACGRTPAGPPGAGGGEASSPSR